MASEQSTENEFLDIGEGCIKKALLQLVHWHLEQIKSGRIGRKLRTAERNGINLIFQLWFVAKGNMGQHSGSTIAHQLCVIKERKSCDIFKDYMET